MSIKHSMKKSISATITASRLIIINDQNKGISVSGVGLKVESVENIISTKKIAANKIPMKDINLRIRTSRTLFFIRSSSVYRLPSV